MGGLFGGGSGGGTSSTVTTQELSDEQKRLIELVIPIAELFINQPPSLFPESRISPFDPLQVQAQELILSLIGQKPSSPGVLSSLISPSSKFGTTPAPNAPAEATTPPPPFDFSQFVPTNLPF